MMAIWQAIQKDDSLNEEISARGKESLGLSRLKIKIGSKT
jgi:hypothetical protein